MNAPKGSVLATSGEKIRLVIWDLDETFWSGTLSEGGVQLVPEASNIVIQLAQKGIISSICSKNDLNPVKRILEDCGLWEYFVFPSINWLPKGPRIAQIIKDVQLRAPTVLFIDDNPSNLEEASRFVPGIQITSEKVVLELLEHPLLRGKADNKLERLQHYKMLERRQADAKSVEGDVESFLRSSNIRVEIDHEVLSRIDRAIELINRTNQLNFTKSRLPDDFGEARQSLINLLDRHDVQAGLIRVADNYGDHGYCGLYVAADGGRTLLHFCFSCRIVGMGIETWLYNHIKRPKLTVAGKDIHNIIEDRRNVDWIKVGRLSEAGDGTKNSIHFLVARGGCDLNAVVHYFNSSVSAICTEFNSDRGNFDVRIDHTLLLAAAAAGKVRDVLPAFSLLGFREEDFVTHLFDGDKGRTLRLLSFWADAFCPLYRHRATNVLVPFPLRTPSGSYQADARKMSRKDLPEKLRNTWVAASLEVLRKEFDYIGVASEEIFKQNLVTVLQSLPPDGSLTILLPADKVLNSRRDGYYIDPACRDLCLWTREVAASFPGVNILHMRDFISKEDDIIDRYHFNRMVYFRLYRALAESGTEKTSGGGTQLCIGN